ncbi:MAG: heme lyase CcmF/NrfE family subunit [Acetobacteraceae bacterium]|nr:heme lyase CcmF/NrfE family subunit [Acetobacteraceae bacterium]
MIGEAGHFALALGFVLSLALSVLPLWGAARGDAALTEAARPLAHGALLAVASAFGFLVSAYVANDTTVLSVVQNSHSLKPLLYKITGVWGNHEGSMLLWVLILALCAASVAAFGGNLPSAFRARVLAVLGWVLAGFLAFILLTSNPFERVWPPPPDGQGLNPLLQDIGLAIHPPLLYVGYVGTAITYAFAVAALIEGRVDSAWGRWVRPWAVASWSFLTLGIAVGSWWAYYELGWGGFWFWDPVENASLLPWLAGTALLHSAIVVEKREALKIWSVLLALLAFGLSLLGTFLVRSGVLNSVHAFANDPERGVFILGLLLFYVGGGFLLFALRAPAMAPAGLFAPVSREGALVLNNLLMCSLAAVVFLGTLWPMFADFLFGATVSVGPPFFNTATFPLVVPLFLAMAAGPLMPWKRAALWPAIERLWAAALAGLAGFLVALAIGGWNPLPLFGVAAAVWLIGAAATDIADRAGLGRTSLANAWNRAKGLPRAAWGAAIAHAGVGVCLLGISGMGFASERIAALSPGQAVAIGAYEWRLEGVRDAAGPNWTSRRATLTVLRHGQPYAVMEPERRFFPIGRQTTTEAAIRTNLLRDLYAVMGEEEGGRAVIRVHYKPLAPLIWIGAIVMALGGFLSLSDRRLRVAGGARRRAAAAGAPA